MSLIIEHLKWLKFKKKHRQLNLQNKCRLTNNPDYYNLWDWSIRRRDSSSSLVESLCLVESSSSTHRLVESSSSSQRVSSSESSPSHGASSSHPRKVLKSHRCDFGGKFEGLFIYFWASVEWSLYSTTLTFAPGAGLPYKRLMGMCRVDGVAFSRLVWL